MTIDLGELWDLDEAGLEEELGQRLEINREEVEAKQALTMAQAIPQPLERTENQGAALDAFRKVGRNFVRRFEAQIYSLVCEESDPDNKQLVDAFKAGAKYFGVALGGYLTATFGFLPGIAVVVGTIIAKRFSRAAYDTVCDEWRQRNAKGSSADAKA
jgi:hypothetical protein